MLANLCSISPFQAGDTCWVSNDIVSNVKNKAMRTGSSVYPSAFALSRRVIGIHMHTQELLGDRPYVNLGLG